MDRFLEKFPGSLQVKVFIAVGTILAASAYPVFSSKESRLGHDYFSHDKPEAIRVSQERMEQIQRDEIMRRGKQ